MKLERDLGTYGRWIIREYLSFRTNGSSAPDRIRDGKSGLVKSVTRASAGLYTVTLRTDRPTTTRHITVDATLHQAASPTVAAYACYVKDSWNQSAGTFQVQVNSLQAAPPVVSDPDTGDRICVVLVGSISSVGQDPA